VRKIISPNDAVEAGTVLDCFIRGLRMPKGLDREAVKRVHDALLSATRDNREHSSVVIMMPQG
jgi:hypothetical protein